MQISNRLHVVCSCAAVLLLGSLSLPSAALAAAVHRPVAADGALIMTDSTDPEIAALVAGAQHEVVELGRSADPLQAILAALTERRAAGAKLDTLHLVAHGRPGALQIASR